VTAPFTLRRLTFADAPAYRDLRLEALRSHPASFGTAWEDEAAQPAGWFADLLGASLVLGGFLPDGTLAGTAGLATTEAAKQRHKATLWGMFVRPAARGTGLAAALVEAVLAEAPPQVEEIRLSVMVTNEAAIRLYTRLGFTRFAVEPRALKIDGRYHDDAMMVRRLRAG
jgi:RimJ/RimL family protein N-acetyltransferase